MALPESQRKTSRVVIVSTSDLWASLERCSRLRSGTRMISWSIMMILLASSWLGRMRKVGEGWTIRPVFERHTAAQFPPESDQFLTRQVFQVLIPEVIAGWVETQCRRIIHKLLRERSFWLPLPLWGEGWEKGSRATAGRPITPLPGPLPQRERGSEVSVPSGLMVIRRYRVETQPTTTVSNWPWGLP